jgi:hypothetical protein
MVKRGRADVTTQILAVPLAFDSVVDRFPLPPVAPPIGETSLTHVIKLAAHSTKPPTSTTMVQ